MAARPGVSRLPGLAWKTSLKLVPAWLVVFSLLGVAAGLVLVPGLGSDPFQPPPVLRVVETLIPLFVGMLAALAFAPESEPALEVLLACCRPAAWTLLERIGACLLVEGSIALLANLVSAGALAPGQEPFLVALARWLAPGLFLAGAAAFVTQVTRQGAFGMLLATLMWGGMLFGGSALLRRYPFLWPIHVYLQPGDPHYALNRLALLAFGIGLILLAAVQTRDEQRLLGI